MAMTVAVARLPSTPSLKLGLCPWRQQAQVQVACLGRGGRGKGEIAARDMELPFGKYRGSMMGTLPSQYLRWMVSNMNGDLEEWAKLADEVLNDPFYRERLEWEQIERHMDKRQRLDALQLQLTGQRTSALGPARAFGWDLDDQAAWSKVNFSLLGTTKGGRIPRLKPGTSSPQATSVAEGAGTVRVVPRGRSRASDRKVLQEMHAGLRAKYIGAASDEPNPETEPVQVPPQAGSLREEMLRRRQLRRERVLATKVPKVKSADGELGKTFPGREGLLRKIKDAI